MSAVKPSNSLQAEARVHLLVTFMITQLYNSLIPRPGDCNKANGAKVLRGRGGGGGDGLASAPCPISSEGHMDDMYVMSGRPPLHKRSDFSIAPLCRDSVLSCPPNPLSYDSFMLSVS